MRFDASTCLGDHDPETVLRRVRKLRAKGFLTAIDVEMDPQDEVQAVIVRGLTWKGERFLERKRSQRASGEQRGPHDAPREPQ